MAFQGSEGPVDSTVCSMVPLPQLILNFNRQHRVEEWEKALSIMLYNAQDLRILQRNRANRIDRSIGRYRDIYLYIFIYREIDLL